VERGHVRSQTPSSKHPRGVNVLELIMKWHRPEGQLKKRQVFNSETYAWLHPVRTSKIHCWQASNSGFIKAYVTG
jgi:hypothetical protein